MVLMDPNNDKPEKVWMRRKTHRLANIEATLSKKKLIDTIDLLIESAASDDAKAILAKEMSQVLNVQPTVSPITKEGPVQGLKQLKELLDTKLITREEYEKKKSEILSRI